MILVGLGCRFKANVSGEFLDDPLRNDETQSNSICVAVLRTLHESKQFEQLVLVLVWDSNTCVTNFDLEVVISIFLNNLRTYNHSSCFCELKGI